MGKIRMTESELCFAELVWREEPLSSGQLVRLCQEEFEWKKSTTYTVLKNLCLRGVLQNQNALVTSRISREEYLKLQSQGFIEDAFGGSLPGFLTAFMGGRKLSGREAEELKQLIDSYKEE